VTQTHHEQRLLGATDTVRQVNQALRDAAARLVAERGDLPAGSVLRCFSRAVRDALRSGCSSADLASEAEWRARGLLERRGSRIPRPRGAA
jgi:hypothetical protein